MKNLSPKNTIRVIENLRNAQSEMEKSYNLWQERWEDLVTECADLTAKGYAIMSPQMIESCEDRHEAYERMQEFNSMHVAIETAIEAVEQ